MSLEVNYSPELDVLSVDDTSIQYGRSVRSGDFVVDLSEEGEVRGLEVQNVSEMLGIDREQLSRISGAELDGKTGQGIRVTLRIEIDETVNTLAAQVAGEEASA